MRRLTVSPLAEYDLDGLLARSEGQFGPAAAERYRRLIDLALGELLSDPERLGVQVSPDLPAPVSLYHLRHSSMATARVRRPRHIIVFSYDPEHVHIVRVLHDSMDLARHVDAPD